MTRAMYTRRIRITLAAALVGLVNACGAPDPSDRTESTVADAPRADPYLCEARPVAADDPSIELDTTFDSTGNRIVVAYRLTNHRSEAVYVVARVPDADGKGGAQGHYVVPRSDGIVEISKRLIRSVDCPKLRYMAPPEPDLLRIDPGATFAEEFTVSLPLTTIHPYQPLDPGDLAPMPSRPGHIFFCVGLMRSKTTTPQLTERDGEQRYDYRDLDFDAQTHLCSDPGPL